MTFATVATRTSEGFNGLNTSHAVSMGTVSSGDKLIVVITGENSGNITTPTDWDVDYHANFGADVDHRAAGYSKTADGSEDSTTVDFVTTNACTMATALYRFASGTYNSIEFGTLATGSGTTPNPPSLSPSYGADDTVWIAVGHGVDDAETFDAAPTNYVNLQSQIATHTGSNDDCEIGTADRENNTATEDPGTFTLSASESWAAMTIAVEPAAAVVDDDPPFDIGFDPIYPSPAAIGYQTKGDLDGRLSR